MTMARGLYGQFIAHRSLTARLNPTRRRLSGSRSWSLDAKLRAAFASDMGDHSKMVRRAAAERNVTFWEN
jgi:hypothetical protein